jgi:hypothetical protein
LAAVPRRLLIILSVLAGALAAPASSSAIVVGIADQKPDMFFDARFQKLKIHHARYTIPWDWRSHGWQIAEMDRWLFFARLRGVHPLVSFGHSRVHRRSLPSPARLARELRRFRARYPWVTNFATWNEANHCGEPTCHKPARVARYWLKLRQACRTCKILAAEVLDTPNLRWWVRGFLRRAKRQPDTWGLHNYVEANRFRTKYLRRLLRQVKGNIWLTEVGGIVKRRGTKKIQRNRVPLPESTRHAAKVTRFIFDRVLPLNRRISRVYLYHWDSTSRFDSWDSALIGWNGKARLAYRVLKLRLAKLRAKQRR